MITLELDVTQPVRSKQVVVGAPYGELAHFISSDLQSVDGVRRQVEHLRAVMAGAVEPEEFTGNAYVVIPARDVTVIEGMYGEPPMMVEVPTSELADLLDRWRAILLAANGPDRAATKP